VKYDITFSERFKKHYMNLHTTMQKQVSEKVKILAENPIHPSLRTKRIKGTKDLYECSVNMSIRLIWYYQNQNIIILLDVGNHDVLKLY
jgi:mRNA-degrading endonuclease YafQ of YafQ-DinJ toxin-antitoxin module